MDIKEKVCKLKKEFKVLSVVKGESRFYSIDIYFTKDLVINFGVDYKFNSAFDYYFKKLNYTIKDVIVKDSSFTNDTGSIIPYYDFYIVLSNDIKIKISVSIKDKFLYKSIALDLVKGLFKNEN